MRNLFLQRSLESLVAASLIFGVGCSHAPVMPQRPISQNHSSVLVGPYLQNVQTEQATVMLETSPETDVSVHLNASSGESIFPSSVERFELVHEGYSPTFISAFRFLNLESNTEYELSTDVSRNDNGVQETSTLTSSFSTLPQYGTLKIGILGDHRGNPGVFHSLLEQITTHNVDMFVSVGDIVNRGREYVQWKEQYFDPAKSFFMTTPSFVAPGNHEYDTSGNNYYFTSFLEQPGNELYFSVEAANALFVFLDTNQDIDVGSQQYTWLKNVLDTNALSSVIVYTHHPFYSAKDSRRGENRMRRNALEDLFETSGVDVVVSGHDHTFLAAQPNNVLYVVSGGGGSSVHDPNTPDTELLAFHPYTWQYCILDVHNDAISVQAYDLDGNKLFDWKK